MSDTTARRLNPEDQQCWGPPIRRPHHESAGRIEHPGQYDNSVRALGDLLSHRGAGIERACFRESTLAAR